MKRSKLIIATKTKSKYSVTTIAVPYIVGIEAANSIPLWIQFIALAVAIGLSALIHFFVYKVGAKELERVDL